MLSAALLGGARARAQLPPPVLIMAHESVKPGVSAAFALNEQGYAVAGAPNGTHYLLHLYSSLATLDSAAAVGQAFGAGLGPEGAKQAEALAAAAIADSRTDIYGFDPTISIPPDSWVSAAPDFWKRGPTVSPSRR